jgi:hypothetical protein
MCHCVRWERRSRRSRTMWQWRAATKSQVTSASDSGRKTAACQIRWRDLLNDGGWAQSCLAPVNALVIRMSSHRPMRHLLDGGRRSLVADSAGQSRALFRAGYKEGCGQPGWRHQNLITNVIRRLPPKMQFVRPRFPSSGDRSRCF